MTTDSQELIDALQDAGYEPRSYSGRNMYGARCVGVTLANTGMMWEMGHKIARGGEWSAPRTDSMSLGIIAYWPDINWPEDAS